MKHLFFLCFGLLIFMNYFPDVQAHEGHHHPEDISAAIIPGSLNESLLYWLPKVGRFHFLILHFPIALIVMTIVAEILGAWFKNPIFDHAARFMILSAAFFVIPTILLGLALSYGQVYSGLSLELFEWHRFFGLLTAGLTLFAAIWRELQVRKEKKRLVPYYVALFFLFFLINITGTFGGTLTFGFFQ